MIKFALPLLFLISSLSAFADNEDQAILIKNNYQYIYGEGYGENQAEADKIALNDLISKISLTLDSKTSLEMQQQANNDDVSMQSSMQMVVNTYTSVHLHNTQSLVLSPSGPAHVLRYVTVADVDKMFAVRHDKAVNYINAAAKAEQNGKLGTAMRYYYWALMLAKSLQDPSQATYQDGDGAIHYMLVYLPMKIEEILTDIDANITEYSDTDATLFFSYNGQPVKELDFTFYNGNSWTPIHSAKNGIAKVDIRPGVDASSLRIRYEYENIATSSLDSEVESLLAIFKPVTFKASEVSITSESSMKHALSKEALAMQKAAIDQAGTNALDQLEGRKPYQKTMEQVIKGLYDRKYETLRPLFTQQGYEMLDTLLHFGKAKMLKDQKYGFYDLGEGRVVCRSLMLSFSFPNNNRTFTEDVTFTFNADKKIEAVSFGLGAEANDDIINRAVGEDGTKYWSDASVLAITTFLENYKTAFALKKLDYLKGVFDDNAVIITGTVLQRPRVSTDGTTYANNEIVQYNHLTKNQYMERLERTFKTQEFVNLRFTDNDVTMMGQGGELFSIQIHQDYYSSSYCDTGYLFLIVDMNDPNKPLIKVRTWQPERDPSINGTYPKNHPDYGLIGPGNF